MKLCNSCGETFSDSEWNCPKCHWNPDRQDGVPIFANELARNTESYDPVWYAELVKFETQHFWFKARNELLQWFAKRFLPKKAKYLELGCGSGFVLKMISESFPDWSISATEAKVEGLKFARSRVPAGTQFLQVDARKIPFIDEFDVVGAFDVIEHIDDDVSVLGEISKALKQDGFVFLSVPQHMFLWSQFDDIGCHFRRYSKRELFTKLEDAGFKVVSSTSFNSLLLPLMMLSRLSKKNESKKVDVMEEFRISKIANGMLYFVMKIEIFCVRLGIRWPAGGSRIVVAQKINKH